MNVTTRCWPLPIAAALAGPPIGAGTGDGQPAGGPAAASSPAPRR
jgi:hypothetical protein